MNFKRVGGPRELKLLTGPRKYHFECLHFFSSLALAELCDISIEIGIN